MTALDPVVASASSHREAPAIAEDQFADNTDVYTFISPNDPDNLVIVANYVPLLIPSSGPNFYKFSDNVAYEIHVDNDGDAKDDMIFRYLFKTTIKNGNTFLYNTGPSSRSTTRTSTSRQTYDVILHRQGERPRGRARRQRPGRAVARRRPLVPERLPTRASRSRRSPSADGCPLLRRPARRAVLRRPARVRPARRRRRADHRRRQRDVARARGADHRLAYGGSAPGRRRARQADGRRHPRHRAPPAHPPAPPRRPGAQPRRLGRRSRASAGR